MWPYIETLLPTIGMLFLLYLVMKHILEGDRRERIANAQWERDHDAAGDQPVSVPESAGEATSDSETGSAKSA